MSKKIVYGLFLMAVIGAAAIWLWSGTGRERAADPDGGSAALSRSAWTAEPESSKVLFSVSLKDKPDSAPVLAAENDEWKLFIEEGPGLVSVQSKKTGTTWAAYPQNRASLPSGQKATVENPVVIRYTQGGGAVSTYPGKEDGTVTAVRIDGGVQLRYSLQTLGLKFAIEYRLTEAGFVVSVPFGSIAEESASRLLTLELLPFFDGAAPDEQGYLFIPDGSGALVRFKSEHLDYFNRYSQPVYGGDPAFVNQTFEKVTNHSKLNVYPNATESVRLPVFGMKRGNQGYAAIIAEGDYNVWITAAPSGYQNAKFYRAAAEFQYRSVDTAYFGESGEVPLTQGKISEGNRTIVYALLEGADADYVGMAGAYRSFLVAQRGVKPIAESKQALPLRLFGGVKRDEIIGSSYVPMTTFAQAKTILDALLDKGIASLELTYEGWSKGGYFGSQPVHFPAAGGLGGDKELGRLLQYTQSKGIPVYLDANYVKPFADAGKLKPSSEAVRGLDREIKLLFDPHPATRQAVQHRSYYLTKPNIAVGKFMEREAGRFGSLGSLGLSGIRLDYMGSLLYSDQDGKGSSGRDQTMKQWVAALDKARAQVGRVAVESGNAYVLGHVDRIDDAPIRSSGFVYEDAAVPFYQIAVRGLVPLTGTPANMRDDAVSDYLRSIEYGVMPSFQLTFEHSSKLKRTMMDSLYSSGFEDWLEAAANEYKAVSALFDAIAGQAITGHKQLADELYVTSYANGVSVAVNYGSSAQTAEGSPVGPASFAIIGTRKGG